MKIIFLDYDGVVNHALKRNYRGEVIYEYVNHLKEIVKETDAKIVSISANRCASNKEEFNVKKELIKNGYCSYESSLMKMGIEIYDFTPKLNLSREEEIEAYLKEHPEVTEFVIIEDDNIIKKFLDHQVLIEYADGLAPEHIGPAINILNGKLGFYPPNFDITETIQERFERILAHSKKIESMKLKKTKDKK